MEPCVSEQNKKGTRQYFKKANEFFFQHGMIFIILSIILIISFMIFLITQIDETNHEFWGDNGDAIGGIIGSFISLFSLLCVFLAYKTQVSANIELRKSNEIIKDQGEKQIKELRESNSILKESERIKMIQTQMAILQQIDFEKQSDELVDMCKQRRIDSVKAYYKKKDMLYSLGEVIYTFNLLDEIDAVARRTLFEKFKLIYDALYAVGVVQILAHVQGYMNYKRKGVDDLSEEAIINENLEEILKLCHEVELKSARLII